MGKVIHEDVKKHLKDIANSLNTYVESQDRKHISKIESYLKSFFELENAKFWCYDDKTMQLKLLDEGDAYMVELEKSLTQQVIESKSPLIENHVTSNKYYCPAVDNPSGYKIKSLLFYPIVKQNKVLGILKLWRGIKQKKKFVKKDEYNLSLFAPLFLDVLEKRSIDKDELLVLLNEKSESTKEKPKQKPTKRVSKIEKKHLSQPSFDEDKYLQKIAQLEKELVDAKKIEEKQSQEIKSLSTEIGQVEKKYASLEKSSEELYSESQNYQQKIAKLTEVNKVLSIDNKELKKALNELQEKQSRENSTKITLESNRILAKDSIDIEKNLEQIFKYIDTSFKSNEYVHILYEIITYALSSKKGLGFIDETLQKNKLLQQILDGYYFQGDLLVRQEKCRMQEIIEHTKHYEKEIFSNTITLNITKDASLPVSLVIDAPKIQNILLHLLIDLFRFVDHSKKLNVHFSFKKKLLYIELGGSIHQKNSLFQSMFKQSKLGGDEKDRLGLQLSKKVLARLKGTIAYDYSNDYYKFMLNIPAQVIKM